jgi:transposase
MPYRKISPDVKLAAVNLYERDLLPLEDILDCVGFSERTFYRILRLWRTTGDVVAHAETLRGRPRLLLVDDVDYIKRLIHHRPDWFLDELLNLLATNRFISVHFTTIHRELERVGVSFKKLKTIAMERNEAGRAAFIARMAQYDPEELAFLDETSKDERTPKRRGGRSKRGRRAEMRGVFVRGRRLSTEGVLTVDGIVASTVVEGSMTKAMFLDFLEHTVVRLPFFRLFRLSSLCSYPCVHHTLVQ